MVVAIRAVRVDELPGQPQAGPGVKSWITLREAHIDEFGEALAQVHGQGLLAYRHPHDVAPGEQPLERLQRELEKATHVVVLLEPLLIKGDSREVFELLAAGLQAGRLKLLPVLLVDIKEEDLDLHVQDDGLAHALRASPVDMRGQVQGPDTAQARERWQALARAMLPPAPPAVSRAGGPAATEPEDLQDEQVSPGSEFEGLQLQVADLRRMLEEVTALLRGAAMTANSRDGRPVGTVEARSGPGARATLALRYSPRLVELLDEMFLGAEFWSLFQDVGGDAFRVCLPFPSTNLEVAMALVEALEDRPELVRVLIDRIRQLRPAREAEIEQVWSDLEIDKRAEERNVTSSLHSDLVEVLIAARNEGLSLPSFLPGAHNWRWQGPLSLLQNAHMIASMLVRGGHLTFELLGHLDISWQTTAYAALRRLERRPMPAHRAAAAVRLAAHFQDALELRWFLRIGPAGDTLYSRLPLGNQLVQTSSVIVESLDARGRLSDLLERCTPPWFVHGSLDLSGDVAARMTPRERVAHGLLRDFSDREDLAREVALLVQATSQDPTLAHLLEFRDVSPFTSAAQTAWLLDAMGLFDDGERRRLSRQGTKCSIISLLDRLTAAGSLSGARAEVGGEGETDRIERCLERLIFDSFHLEWLFGTSTGLSVGNELSRFWLWRNLKVVTRLTRESSGWDLAHEAEVDTIEALSQRLRWQYARHLNRSGVPRWSLHGVDRWDALVRLGLDHREWLLVGLHELEFVRDIRLWRGVGILEQVSLLLQGVAMLGVLPDFIAHWARAVPAAAGDLRHIFPDLERISTRHAPQHAPAR